MEKIKVHWAVSIDSGCENISLEDMNVKDINEWNDLTYDEQEEKLQEALFNLPERVYIMPEKWNLT